MATFEACIEYAKEKVGIYALKEKQEEALRALFEERDVVCVLPTGYGKSVIFQILPFMVQKKRDSATLPIVVVVAPLNAIMQDQLMGLKKKGIDACFLDVQGTEVVTCHIKVKRMDNDNDEDEDPEGKEDVVFSNISINEIKKGEFCLLYAHPETLLKNKEIGRILRSPLYQRQVCCTVIDEVHMVSEWGKDFRKAFSELGQLTSIFSKVPHLALTATATSSDLKLLSSLLEFQNTHFIVANPDRPNIYLEIRKRLPNIRKYEKYDEILKTIGSEILVQLEAFPVTLVYCDNLESVGYSYMYIYQILGSKAYCGKEAIPENRIVAQYHKDYATRMKNFIVHEITKPNPKVRLIFATVALGMGLNAPSVTRVIHFRPPTTLEKYLQEIGRAGRTGLPSQAIMYYNNNDIAPNRKGLDSAVRDFVLNNNGCLRLHLLKYFGFEKCIYNGPKELCCSNCKQ
ncbi:uncharacterized protein LOC134282890 [Saccostrea cucullata]|uniref:uncharacterized protein LOC134282890 n=1 Tax=Saccostrea cuccullata TaxID=36930 RepID=UPI002ED40D2A